MEYTGNDEFRKISEAFNRMLETIRSSTRQIHQSNIELEALAANIPGGVIKCRCDKYFTIIFASDSFLNLTGYTDEELKNCFSYKLTALIHPDDFEHLPGLNICSENTSSTAIEYRIIKKNGQVVWVLNRIRKTVDENNVPCYYCVLIDITGEKEARINLAISEERYRLVMEQSESILFEWNILDGTVYYSSNWSINFDFEPITENFPESLLAAELIHEKDKPILDEFFKAIASGLPFVSQDVRIKNRGDYMWFAIRATVIFDKKGQPAKAVGKISDIDKYKKEAELLALKADLDPLTGLYNKSATKNLIDGYLSSANIEEYHALLLIDIDNFKAVNDNFGHLFGDAVLSEISSKIRRLFRSSDIAGRIGGDEFVIFLKNVTSTDLLIKKAEEITNVFRKSFTGENNDYRISGSIGAALYPQNGKNYEELLKKADIALYNAKYNGKDCVCIYDQHLMPVESLNTRISVTKISDHSFKENIENDIFELLYQTKDIYSAISLILELIGNHFGVSRAYIFENSKDGAYCSNTYEWCNDGISSEKEKLQKIPFTLLGDYRENFNEDGILYADDITSLSPDVAELLQSQHIVSMLQCVILKDGIFSGYVGFDECSGTRVWTDAEVKILTFVSKIISTFLLKKQAQDEVSRTYNMTQSVMDNMSNFTYVIDRDTHDLLYLNRRVCDIAPEAETGKKCYRVFWNNRDTPCEHCPMDGLGSMVDTSILELYNPNFGVWTNATASKMKWENGQEVCLVSCFDITKYKEKSV